MYTKGEMTVNQWINLRRIDIFAAEFILAQKVRLYFCFLRICLIILGKTLWPCDFLNTTEQIYS